MVASGADWAGPDPADISCSEEHPCISDAASSGTISKTCPAGTIGIATTLSATSLSGVITRHMLVCDVCSAAGTFCSGRIENVSSYSAVAADLPCPAGFWCPNTYTQLVCPPSYYCARGSQYPTSCPVLAYCPTGSARPLHLVTYALVGAALGFLLLSLWVSRLRHWEAYYRDQAAAHYALRYAAPLRRWAAVARHRLWWQGGMVGPDPLHHRGRSVLGSGISSATALALAAGGAPTPGAAHGPLLLTDGSSLGSAPAHLQAGAGPVRALMHPHPQLPLSLRAGLGICQSPSTFGGAVAATEGGVVAASASAAAGGGGGSGRYAVVLDDLSIRLRGSHRCVMSGVSLALGAGQLHAIMGPSGCGKSLLLQCIAGRADPAAIDVGGSIRFVQDGSGCASSPAATASAVGHTPAAAVGSGSGATAPLRSTRNAQPPSSSAGAGRAMEPAPVKADSASKDAGVRSDGSEAAAPGGIPRACVAYLPQVDVLPESLTVHEALTYALQLHEAALAAQAAAGGGAEGLAGEPSALPMQHGANPLQDAARGSRRPSAESSVSCSSADAAVAAEAGIAPQAAGAGPAHAGAGAAGRPAGTGAGSSDAAGAAAAANAQLLADVERLLDLHTIRHNIVRSVEQQNQGGGGAGSDGAEGAGGDVSGGQRKRREWRAVGQAGFY